jgi:hypothetical protein
MPRSSTSGQGRPRGVPNKLTSDVKAMILAALDKAGGVDYLARQAEENPGPFLALLSKMLPLGVTGEGGGPLVISWMANKSDEATP